MYFSPIPFSFLSSPKYNNYSEVYVYFSPTCIYSFALYVRVIDYTCNFILCVFNWHINGTSWSENAAFKKLSFYDLSMLIRASLVAQTVKKLLAIQETWVWSLDRDDLLEKEMATHTSVLAWRISWTEEPCGLQSMGLQRVEHNCANNALIFMMIHVDLVHPVQQLCILLNEYIRIYIFFLFMDTFVHYLYFYYVIYAFIQLKIMLQYLCTVFPQYTCVRVSLISLKSMLILQCEIVGATHSSVLAWTIPGMGEPGGLQSMGSHRVRHDWSNLAAAAGLLELYLKLLNFSTACLCQLTLPLAMYEGCIVLKSLLTHGIARLFNFSFNGCEILFHRRIIRG